MKRYLGSRKKTTMKTEILTALLVLSSTNISSATFFGNKERRGFFGFGYSSSSAPATPVYAVAHHHHHLAYNSPITRVAYASPPFPYPEPVAKVALAQHNPIPYDFSFPTQVIPYAAPWPRIVYHQPEAVAKLAYTTVPLTKLPYAAQSPIVAKFAYAAPSIKKFGYDFGHY